MSLKLERFQITNRYCKVVGVSVNVARWHWLQRAYGRYRNIVELVGDSRRHITVTRVCRPSEYSSR